jgi:hypothetical protein
MTSYDFTKDLAANIVYAEVKHFAATENANVRTEDEIQTLTRRLSYLVDRDLHWCDVDELVDQVNHYRELRAGHESFLSYLRFNIESMLGSLKVRLEVAA